MAVQDVDLRGLTIDFGLRSEDYARQRPGFPDSFYDRIEALHPLRGARVLDLGTGPGVVAFPLIERGAHVTGIDVSPQQIGAARVQAAERGLTERCVFEVGRAEQTPFADESFDLVTAGTCWHWFDPDAALAECVRVLVPGGHLVIATDIYLPRHSDIARESEDLVRKHNPSWQLGNFDGLLPQFIDPVITKRTRLVEQFCYDHVREMTHEAWRGRMRTCNGVGSGGMDPETVERFDADLAQLLADRYPGPLSIPHRIFTVIAQKLA